MKRTKRLCKECKTEQFIFSKGRCRGCAIKTYPTLNRNPIKRRYKKKTVNGRGEFFRRHINKIPRYCEECMGLNEGGVQNVCHILPKSVYPEVELLDSNIMYYCQDCHIKFDSSPYDRHLFKSFSKVLDRFSKIESHIEETHRKMYRYLKGHLDSIK